VYGAPQPFPYADEQLGKQGRRMQPEETGPLSLDALLRQGDALYLPRGQSPPCPRTAPPVPPLPL